MKKYVRATFASLILSSVTLFLPANAMVVYDPSNYVQNTTSAIAAVKNEINTAASYIQSVKQTIMFIKQLTSLEGLARLTGLGEELQLFQQLQSTGMELKRSLEEASSLGNDMKAQIGSSNFSLKKYMQSAGQNDLNRAKIMMDRFATINEAMAQTTKKRQDILDQMSGSDGSIAAATQATTAAVDVVIGQNNQVIGALGTQLAIAAQEKIDKVNKEEGAANSWNQYSDTVKSTVDAYK